MNPLKERVDVYVPYLKVSLKMGFDRIVHTYMTNLGLSYERRFLRKEVIQPQVPLRLPCYDFTPVTSPTLGAPLHEG